MIEIVFKGVVNGRSLDSLRLIFYCEKIVYSIQNLHDRSPPSIPLQVYQWVHDGHPHSSTETVFGTED